MPTSLISPGPITPISQGVVYALPASPCIITSGALVQKSASFGGTYSDWVGSTGGIYHGGSTVQSHVKCLTGNTTIQALKVKMTGPFSKGSYSESVAKSGPSNYWMLNESTGLVARDSIGGVNGTISGGVVLNGVNGMSFNGTTGKIVTSAQPLPTKFSVEAWIKTTVVGPRTIFSNFITAAVYEIFVGIENAGKVHFLVAGAAQIYSTSNVANGLWYHIVCTLDTSVGVYKIFVNGQEEVSGGMSIAVITNPWNIGFNPLNDQYWSGSIDEVAVYPRALTPSEILSHYQSR